MALVRHRSKRRRVVHFFIPIAEARAELAQALREASFSVHGLDLSLVDVAPWQGDAELAKALFAVGVPQRFPFEACYFVNPRSTVMDSKS